MILILYKKNWQMEEKVHLSSEFKQIFIGTFNIDLKNSTCVNIIRTRHEFKLLLEFLRTLIYLKKTYCFVYVAKHICTKIKARKSTSTVTGIKFLVVLCKR